ncbi:MAG: hypothetical protein DWQ49_12215 [Bacteroidetes bacterium]|nr:MAG: hypothetical protein DWQ49_12215 [Bacteroidota bacterium]
MAQANVKLTVDASQATRALKGVQAQTTGLQNAFGGLKTAIASIGIGLVAKQAISTASDFQALELRMKVLTSEFGEFAQAQELVAKAQDKFNLSIIEATRGVTDIFARLRPLGISLKDIETTFLGFNTIAIQAGLNATEASAAFTQLAQGLGSGRLQGDEFRSIAEQVPQLLVAISKETGIATGKLKDFASKGLLTSDIILRALNRSLEEGEDKIDAIMDASPAQVFKEFSNAVLELQITLGSKLLPSVLKLTKATSALIEGIVAFIDSEAGSVTFAFIGIAAAIKGITVVGTLLITQIAALKANFLAMSTAAAIANGKLSATTTMAFATAGGFTKAAAAASAFRLALAKTGIGLAVIALGGFIAKLMQANNEQRTFNELLQEGSADALKAEIEDLQKEQDILNTQLDNTNRILDAFLNITGLDIFTRNINDIKRDLIVVNNKIKSLKDGLPNAEARDLAKEFERHRKALTDTNASIEKNLIIEKEETELAKLRKENELNIQEIINEHGVVRGQELILLENQNFELKKQGLQMKENQKEAERIKGIFKEIGNDIATGISDALVDAIEGTRSLGEAARAIVNDLASSLLRLGINTLLRRSFGGIFSDLPGLANGGRASAGRSYLVGERGPEIFTPKSSGTVIPNNQIGGGGTNIVVNVSAEGMQSNANEDRGKELGVALASAIQSELIKQKRPGGLLAT